MLQQPIAAEVNTKLEVLRERLQTLLSALKDCILNPSRENCNRTEGDAMQSALIITKCRTRRALVRQSTHVNYEYENSRQGFGHWVAQVQSRSTGGEGGALQSIFWHFLHSPCLWILRRCHVTLSTQYHTA